MKALGSARGTCGDIVGAAVENTPSPRGRLSLCEQSGDSIATVLQPHQGHWPAQVPLLFAGFPLC